METTTFDNDQLAAAAARAAGERLAALLPAPASAALERAVGVARIVAHFDPEPAAIEGTALASLVASGALDPDSVGAKVAPDALAFARALGRLGRLDPAAAAAGPLPPAQAETLRKMLLAVVADPRLVLARVAEQLWLLRAARQADAAECRRLAAQTRDIYAPLANRLGLAVLKWELEDYSFRYLEPDAYRQIAASLNERRSDRERYIAEFRALLGGALAAAGVKTQIEGRPKHIFSIWRKMRRKGLAFEQVFDVRAVRILVGSVADCYAALGVVHSLWDYVPAEFDDYIATPKSNGYRSIHTAVLGPGGKAVEVQIRTQEMHDRAELGVAAHWRYKEGGRRDLGFEAKVEQLRALLAPGAAAEDDPLGQVGAALFADHVYVLSPKGDVVELPAGATPLDFAYHVHTSLGHRCRGARVDGRMVPLDHRLENGATIEIITAKDPQPSRDWLVESLGFLASKSARAKVRAWFRHVDEAEHARAGRAVLERELGRRGVAPAVAEIAAELGFASAAQLYVALGAGDVSAAQLAAALQRRDRAVEPGLPAAAAGPAGADVGPVAAHGIRVMGVGDLLSHFARCCRPVPPEPIVGYVTLGRGVTIHRATCGNLARMQTRQPDRVLPVDWGGDRDRLYPVEFSVLAFDRRGLVRDVSGIVADARLSIDRMTTATNQADKTADMTLAVKVHDLGELEAVAARIAGLPDVIRVHRR
ncbi:MAG TPA: bifunctional (p)ppGpp synthetase/guanosine-3',5'-bis(diphosphate) 3'-pyrophosphohydrolase [Steroidobacteraceae bacterium]|nr:bifunctional (p)ppGpp synthetase/guanosine-3',5'-bis(diphosphate) 3'-pyrophosphohydrolase [Steroidobacteraceae bacterium]